MPDSLRNQAVKGGIWSGIQSFGATGMLFVCNIVLARLLTPHDFGCIGLLLIFIMISDAIVDGGFASALIQKKGANELDYSTIFWWNLLLSVLLYIILFFTAPFIATYFKIDILTPVLRVYGIVLFFHGLSLVQNAVFTKRLQFKTVALTQLVANFSGTLLAIICAFFDYGIWSLVVKVLVTGIVQCVSLWLISDWIPRLKFSIQSFRSLFKFGFFIFLATISDALYLNSVSLVLGKAFSPSTLGYFTQGRKLEDVPRQTISSVINKIAFPIFTTISDDKSRFKDSYRRTLSLLCFISFPLTVWFIVTAKPLILLLFSEKWLIAYKFMQVVCLYSLIEGVIILNQEIYKALGKSDMLFLSGILRRVIGVSLIILSVAGGLKILLFVYVLTQYISFVIVTYPLKKIIGYGTIDQVLTMLPSLLTAGLVGIITFSLFEFLKINNNFVLLLSETILFVGLYLLASALIKCDGYRVAYSLISARLLPKNHKHPSDNI